MARRIARVFSTLIVAAGLLIGALLVLPAALGWQRYVIVSGSMTGTYDRGSLVLDDVVPVASLREGDVITYRPPVGSGPAGLVTHRIAAITTDKLGRRSFRTKGDANEAADPWTFQLPKGEQARVRMGVPYVGFALAALGQARPADADRRLPGGPDRPLQHRRPLAGDGPRSRRGAPMKHAALLLLVVAAVAALSGGVGRSQATFVAGSEPGRPDLRRLRAFNGVSVSLGDPGSPLRSTVPLSATATSDRALVSVTFQRSPAGAGTWTTICAPTAAPYTCSWDSTGASDGLYDLRAVALDASGYSKTSTVASRRVDNTAPATSVTAATPLTGTATVSATATDGGSGVISVAFEARPSSGGSWTPICTTAAPPTPALGHTAVADGAWDVRATATDGAGNTSSSTTANRIVDNTSPTITLDRPRHALGATVTLASTTGDGAGSGVGRCSTSTDQPSTGAWTTACTGADAPFSCSWATPATGTYDVRAIATDGVGKADDLRDDPRPPGRQHDPERGRDTRTRHAAARLRDPQRHRRGRELQPPLDALRVQARAPAARGATAGTDAPALYPLSCTWDTTAVSDGSYDLRGDRDRRGLKHPHLQPPSPRGWSTTPARP